MTVDRALDLHNSHIPIDGTFVPERVVRIIEAINDYSDGQLEVRWIPPRGRKPNQAAFTIWCHPTDGQPEYCVKAIKDEDEFDERVLKAIIAGDQRNGAVKLSDFEAWEAAQALIKKQERLDALEAVQDMVKHIIATNKNTYVVDKDLVIKEGIPFNAKRLK